MADPSDRAVLDLGLRPLACWYCVWFRILPGAWISVSCECCVYSGRGLCVGLITLIEESYQVRCVQ